MRMERAGIAGTVIVFAHVVRRWQTRSSNANLAAFRGVLEGADTSMDLVGW